VAWGAGDPVETGSDASVTNAGEVKTRGVGEDGRELNVAELWCFIAERSGIGLVKGIWGDGEWSDIVCELHKGTKEKQRPKAVAGIFTRALTSDIIRAF